MEAAGAFGGSVPAPGEESLTRWIEGQYAISATRMLGAISATRLIKERRGFGQTIRPVKGSILASIAIGAWDPDPDYFFHWVRDSAAAINAVRHLIRSGPHAGEAAAHCGDFASFSLALTHLDGRDFLRHAGDFRKQVEPGFRQFVREDEELLSVSGDRVLGEPRFNPDATLDISKWSRPQHDGPAFRALALMRLWPIAALDETARADMRKLILTDLGFICRHWREPCFDIWEEENGEHYCTKLLHYAALEDGANWAPRAAAPELAHKFRETADAIAPALDEFWSPGRSFYLSRRNVTNGAGGKELDFAVILAVIHAARKSGKHSVLDPKAMATLAALERLFDRLYPINRGRPPHLGPAMGRYAHDNYFSGGAYYFSTLGAAEFYYRLAAAVAGGAQLSVTAENKPFLSALGLAGHVREYPHEEPRKPAFEALLARGDQFMATVAAYTPSSGELSEQFDQKTGAQTSAKTLTWSHAAFITAAVSRRSAREAAGLAYLQFPCPP